MMYLSEVDRIKHIREDMVARGEPLYSYKEVLMNIDKEWEYIVKLYRMGFVTSDEKAKLKGRLSRLRRRAYALTDIDVEL